MRFIFQTLVCTVLIFVLIVAFYSPPHGGTRRLGMTIEHGAKP